MTTQIAHDPFARASLMRETHYRMDGTTCAWCGGVSKARSGYAPRLFHYFWEDDSGRKPFFSQPRNNELFCSVSCFRTYS